MRKFEVYCLQVYFVILLVALCYGGGKGDKRKSTVLGLLPFPRVGRSENTWDFDPEYFNEYKRTKQLMAFPRVGRSGFDTNYEDMDYTDKRTGEHNKNAGLWFGPRLGRLHKRDTIYRDTPLAYFIYGDSTATRDVHYTPRLGRESEENYDDGSEERRTTP